MVGEKLSVTATAANGNEFDSEATAPVKADKAGEIKLVDDNGLQEDGTARTTDTLRVSYGADLGTPKNVTWFCNGAVMSVFTLDAGNLTQAAFNSDACRSKNPVVLLGQNVYTELEAGEWMVSIESTDGDMWISNSVEVVYEGVAVMSDVSIEDDYETDLETGVSGIQFDTKTDNAILNVTFNKDYTGDLYLINSKYANDINNHKDNQTSWATDANGALSIKEALTKVNTAAQLTNKAATAATVAGVGAEGHGIYWEDANGALHCKIVVNLTEDDGSTEAKGAVNRGDSYFLVWDQADVTDDSITASSKRDDLNTSEDIVVPYVEGPAAIKVASYKQNGTTAKIAFLDEDGDVLDWINDSTMDAFDEVGLLNAKIYTVDTNAKSSGDTYVSGTFPGTGGTDKGTLAITYADGLTSKYVYVKVKTVAGVFAKNSVELESPISESAISAMTSISIAQDSSDPYAAKVTLKGLSSKAPGTVYVFQGSKDTEVYTPDDGTTDTAGHKTDNDADENATAFNTLNTKKVEDAIASKHVEGGTSSVIIENVFEEKDLTNVAIGNDMFGVRFVPDDTELWLEQTPDVTFEDGTGEDVTVPTGFHLTQKVKTYKLSDPISGKKAAQLATAGKVVGVDQFGQDVDPDVTALDALATCGLTNTALKDTVDETTGAVPAGNGKITVTITDHGVISIAVGTAGAIVKGTYQEITLPSSQKMKITASKGAAAIADAEWTITIS